MHLRKADLLTYPDEDHRQEEFPGLVKSNCFSFTLIFDVISPVTEFQVEQVLGVFGKVFVFCVVFLLVLKLLKCFINLLLRKISLFPVNKSFIN